MRKTLEKLYYGNLRPCERRVIPNSELRRAVDTITKCEQQIESQLDEAGQKILTEMSDAQQTADNIMALENFILGFRLGAKKMTSLTAMDIQRMYTKLKKEGRVREHPEYGRALSASTIRRIHTMLHRALGDAVRAHIIPRNPAEGLTLPKSDPAPKRILTDQELDSFMGTIKTDLVWHDFFYTALTTGLRRGEICGLMWSDFDSTVGTLQISRTLHKKSGGGFELGETKTGTGRRRIFLPQSTADLLRERQKSASSRWIFPDLLRPERPVPPDAAYRRLKVLLEHARLPNIPFHNLRHTFCTHALASGVDAKTLAGILGHTDATFTLNTYTHVTGDMQRRASAVVGNFLEDIFGKELQPWQSAENVGKEVSV